MNLILFEAAEVEKDPETGTLAVSLIPTDRRSIHCMTVLKISLNSTVRVGIVSGDMHDGTVVEMDPIRIEFGNILPGSELGKISLILAMPRPKVLNRLWAVFAQLGFRRVILVNAERVEKCYFSSHVLGESNYRPRLIKGLEQAAASTRVPEIAIDKRPLDVFLNQRVDVAFPNTRRFVCHPKACSVQNSQELAEETVIAVGPEGGWLDFEIEALLSHGFNPVTCSSRIFTTEVAIVALTSAIAATLDPKLLGTNIQKIDQM